VRAGDSLDRLDRDLELALRVLGEEEFRLRSCLPQRSHHVTGEWLCAPLSLERERQRWRHAVRELELVLEARENADSELALELAERLAQEVPRTRLPGLAVGLDDVAQHELERAVGGVPPDANLGFGIGQQPQIAGGAERVGFGYGPERRERLVGGCPAHPE